LCGLSGLTIYRKQSYLFAARGDCWDGPAALKSTTASPKIGARSTAMSLELAQFQQFIANQVATGSTISPEEALDLWRQENPLQSTFEEDVLALRAALADLDAGERGIPLAEFEKEFRRRYGLASDE
jgi:hypothetical protein